LAFAHSFRRYRFLSANVKKYPLTFCTA
jgi:hypothetical protein